MSTLHQIEIAGGPRLRKFHARSGQNLLEAALTGGVDVPHDCRAGRCGACLTRVADGYTLGGETRTPGLVHACQALVFSDLTLKYEQLPPVTQIAGRSRPSTIWPRGSSA